MTFTVAVVVLLAPWPGYPRVCAAAFSAFGNGVAHVLGVGQAAEQQFSLPETIDSPGRHRTIGEWSVWLSRRGADAESPKAPVDTRILAYTPLAIFLALTLATAVPRRRKLVVFAVGLVVVLARLALAIVLPVGATAEVVWLVLISPPVMSYATPLFAWWIALTVTTPRSPERPAGGSGGRRRGHDDAPDHGPGLAGPPGRCRAPVRAGA